MNKNIDEACESVETFNQGIQNSERRSKRTIKLYSPDLRLELPLNSLVLVGGVTGGGKTSFLVQCAAYAWLQKKKVLFCSNEESAEALTKEIIKQARALGLKDEEIIRDGSIVNLKCLTNQNTNSAIGTFDEGPELIFTAIEKIKPDLVLYDHLNTSIGSKRKRSIEPYKALNEFMSKFKEAANSGADYPPIVLTQQSQTPSNPKPDTWDMPSLLKGCKTTLEPCTHGILIVPGSDGSRLLKIWKSRLGFPKAPLELTRWALGESGLPTLLGEV